MIRQFIIRFQMLHNQLTRAPPEDEVKAIFLAALQEPVQTMLAVLDFRTSIVDDVIEQVLEMDRAQNNNYMAMRALKHALPREEELRFQQAVQCTTCLNPDHSTGECTMRTQCLFCHSKTHTMDRCEYNLLNRLVASVKQIEPREDED